MPLDPSFISSLPFFEGFSEEDVLALTSVAQTKLVKTGEMVAQAGETLNFLVFVSAGCLQVHEISEDGRIIGIGSVKPGEGIGWLQLIDALPLTSSVHAVEATTLTLIPMPVAQKLALTRPLFIERLLKLLAKSIRQAQSEKAMLSLPNAFHRVIVQLKNLSNDHTAALADEQSLQHLPKQHELASIVNTSRETVSRALQLLIKNGVLSKDGHNIVIERGDLLNKLVSEGPDALKTLQK